MEQISTAIIYNNIVNQFRPISIIFRQISTVFRPHFDQLRSYFDKFRPMSTKFRQIFDHSRTFFDQISIRQISTKKSYICQPFSKRFLELSTNFDHVRPFSDKFQHFEKVQQISTFQHFEYFWQISKKWLQKKSEDISRKLLQNPKKVWEIKFAEKFLLHFAYMFILSMIFFSSFSCMSKYILIQIGWIFENLRISNWE